MKVARYEVPGKGEKTGPVPEGTTEALPGDAATSPPVRRHQQHPDQASLPDPSPLFNPSIQNDP
jgi:hypothetical protein